MEKTTTNTLSFRLKVLRINKYFMLILYTHKIIGEGAYGCVL